MLRDTHHGKACPYCQRVMDRGDRRLTPTRDHVIPASRGGTVKIICCITCNGIKGAMMPDDWAAFMTDCPGWWRLSCQELRAMRRADRRLRGVPNENGDRIIKRGGRRQGTPPMPPVIVPPELIY